jgi:hypothetical protein
MLRLFGIDRSETSDRSEMSGRWTLPFSQHTAVGLESSSSPYRASLNKIVFVFVFVCFLLAAKVKR